MKGKRVEKTVEVELPPEVEMEALRRAKRYDDLENLDEYLREYVHVDFEFIPSDTPDKNDFLRTSAD